MFAYTRLSRQRSARLRRVRSTTNSDWNKTKQNEETSRSRSESVPGSSKRQSLAGNDSRPAAQFKSKYAPPDLVQPRILSRIEDSRGKESLNRSLVGAK